MTPYKSKSGKESGVTAYRIGQDFITVQFNGTEYYTYSYRSEKRQVIEKMKKLALASKGLSTFISKNKPRYE